MKVLSRIFRTLFDIKIVIHDILFIENILKYIYFLKLLYQTIRKNKSKKKSIFFPGTRTNNVVKQGFKIPSLKLQRFSPSATRNPRLNLVEFSS